MIRYAHVSGKPIRYLHIPSDRPASLFISGNLQEIERVQYFSERLAKQFCISPFTYTVQPQTVPLNDIWILYFNRDYILHISQ